MIFRHCERKEPCIDEDLQVGNCRLKLYSLVTTDRDEMFFY